MEENVIISRMENNNGKTTIYFMVPSLNIDSHYDMETNKFSSVLTSRGFSGLAQELLKELDNGIQALIK